MTWVQHMSATPTGVSANMVWYYKEQANQGNSAAILNLAICHLSGVGMLKDKVEGVKLLRDAAGRGNAMAVRHCAAGFLVQCRSPPSSPPLPSLFAQKRSQLFARRQTRSVCACGWAKVPPWT